jgi:hypothetical protein
LQVVEIKPISTTTRNNSKQDITTLFVCIRQDEAILRAGLSLPAATSGGSE